MQEEKLKELSQKNMPKIQSGRYTSDDEQDKSVQELAYDERQAELTKYYGHNSTPPPEEISRPESQ